MKKIVQALSVLCIGTIMLCTTQLQGARLDQALANFSASLNALTSSLANAPKPAECTSCLEERVLLALSCGYALCPECWTTLIETELNEKKADTIKCPACARVLAEQDIKTIQDASTTKDLVTRWRDVKKEQDIDKDPTKKRCPSRNCTGVLTVPKDEKGKATCPKCGEKLCFACGLQHGDDVTCAFARRQLSGEDFNSRMVVKLTTKKCPTCGTPTEKTEGCLHMTGCQCGVGYCWACLRPDPQCAGSYNCRTLHDDFCPLCRQQAVGDGTFMIHDQCGSYQPHRAHIKHLLELLEVDPEKGLLFDPSLLKAQFYLPSDIANYQKDGRDQTFNDPFAPPTIPIANGANVALMLDFNGRGNQKSRIKNGAQMTTFSNMFPCPFCGIKVKVTVSDDKKKLLFQDIVVQEIGNTDSNKWVYYKIPSEQKPIRELVLVTEQEIDFFDTPERFEEALQKKFPDNRSTQQLYNACYNRLHELWNSRARTTTEPPEQTNNFAKYLLSPSIRTYFTQKEAAIYANNLLKHVIFEPNFVEFFKQLGTELRLEQLAQHLLEELDLRDTPFWPLMPLISRKNLKEITRMLGNQARQFAAYITILKDVHKEDQRKQPREEIRLNE